MKTSKTSASSSVSSVAQSTTAPKSPFRTGQILTGTVISELAPRCFYVDFGHTATTAQSNLRLKPGNRIKVHVASTKGKVTLKLLGDETQAEMGLEEQLAALLNHLGLPITPILMELAWTIARFGMRPDKDKLELLSDFLKTANSDSPAETELAVWLMKTRGTLDAAEFSKLRNLSVFEPGSWTNQIPVLAHSISQIKKHNPHTDKFDGLQILIELFPKNESPETAGKKLIELALSDARLSQDNNLCAQLITELKKTRALLQKQQHTNTQEKVFLDACTKMLRGLKADQLLSAISIAGNQGTLATFAFLNTGKIGLLTTRCLTAGTHSWISFALTTAQARRLSAYLSVDRMNAQVNIFSSDNDFINFAKEHSPDIRKLLKKQGLEDIEIKCQETKDEQETITPPAFPGHSTKGLDIIA